MQLLEQDWSDRTLQTGLKALDRSFDYFDQKHCFNSSCPSSTWCVATPCCCDWSDSIEGSI
jgi:hypothetical protein